jgi:regulator of replication initiation timing
MNRKKRKECCYSGIFNKIDHIENRINEIKNQLANLKDDLVDHNDEKMATTLMETELQGDA